MMRIVTLPALILILTSVSFPNATPHGLPSNQGVTHPSIQTIPEIRPVDQKLYAAIRNGNVAQVKSLLEHGADANANEANGSRPLLDLPGTPDQRLAIAKLLVEHGADVNYRQPDQGWTAISSAINRGQGLNLLQFLISKGARVDTPMSDGTTALRLAVGRGLPDIVKLLLANGASVKTTTTGAGESMVEPDQEFEPGFQVGGETPAFGLAMAWNPEIEKMLVQAGADLQARDVNGWTILHFAAKYGEDEAVQGALDAGIDPNVASNRGFTPLHIAGRSGYGYPKLTTIKLLLAHGAKPNLRTSDGKTPADLIRDVAVSRLRDTLETKGQLDQQAWFAQYITVCNQAIQLLDPGEPPIDVPTSLAKLPPLKIPDFNADQTLPGLLIDRTVTLVDGKAILRLHPEKPLAYPIVFKKLMLNNYEALDGLPQRVLKGSELSVAFPGRAVEGGAIRGSWSVTLENGSSEGEILEGWSPDPGLAEDGSKIAFECELVDRDLELVIDSFKLNGKLVKALTGLKLTMIRGHQAPIPVQLAPTARWDMTYRYRLVGNKTWTTQHLGS